MAQRQSQKRPLTFDVVYKTTNVLCCLTTALLFDFLLVTSLERSQNFDTLEICMSIELKAPHIMDGSIIFCCSAVPRKFVNFFFLSSESICMHVHKHMQQTIAIQLQLYDTSPFPHRLMKL